MHGGGTFWTSLSSRADCLMPLRFASVRRHLGLSIPVFILFAAVVLFASGGRVDGQILSVLGFVLLLTLLTPVAISAMNRRWLRGSWMPELASGEQVLHDGPADRYEAGHHGWLFLTSQRLALYRLDGSPEWSASLDEIAEVQAARYAGILATDLRVRLRSGTTETLKVEGSREWEAKVRGAMTAIADSTDPWTQTPLPSRAPR